MILAIVLCWLLRENCFPATVYRFRRRASGSIRPLDQRYCAVAANFRVVVGVGAIDVHGLTRAAAGAFLLATPVWKPKR